MPSDKVPAIRKSERTAWYPGMVLIDLHPDMPRTTLPGDGILLLAMTDVPADVPVTIENTYRRASCLPRKQRMLLDFVADAAIEADTAITCMMGG